MPGTAETLTLEQLHVRAAALWVELAPSSVVWLTGELGAGKTTFVQALVRAGAGEEARSPTYALVHEYDSPGGVLVHVDCYRLRDPEEALDLDFADLQRRGRLLMIEWPERGGAHVPRPDAHIHLAHGDRDSVRRLERVR
ncbi:MAG: tRNA (adenosine(37)-N6)-threonylcarbamoyltransferase complex ATPase subunit type 1 TsaE [Gemmatimonadetes bacterium]|nr:tRNA (adenosine(37)-N6)-threonylcarbamoyltransferase complex ATPase subunit type 1 TsaE [Gemmatimonadota bacterium]